MEGWFNEAQTDNRPYENGLFGFHDKYQAMDNIRWVAKQLQCADQLEYLSLSADLEMEDVHEEERTPTLLNAKGLLQPFKCLRSIKKLEIGNLQLDMDTCIENGELPGNFPSLSARTLKKRRAEILRIREPVRPDPIPLDTWLDFKHTVNSILNNASCTTVARSLKSAAKAFEKQDKEAFCMAIFLLDTAWESEKKMGNMIESMFSRLEQTKFLDVELGKSRKDYPDGMESQEVD
ncbi:hypothetical protein GTA08_BOTSDO03958 [Neofusicoccum parvum]|nr:hypothetical protein GTA08_BOTSDO03958 [Neofusicoccum parvum]